MTRERIPSELTTFHMYVGSSQNKLIVSTSKLSSSSKSEATVKPLNKPSATSTYPRESSSPCTELSLSSSKLSSSRESEAVVAQHASVSVEETPGIAREETPRKSDSPDARADIRRKAGEATTANIAKKQEETCRHPLLRAPPPATKIALPAVSRGPRRIRSRWRCSMPAWRRRRPRHSKGVEIYLQKAHNARLHLGGHLIGEGELLIRA